MGEMARTSEQSSTLIQLLDLHAIDQEIASLERQAEERKNELAAFEEGVAGLESKLERLDTELEQARLEARRNERVVDEKRDTLDRLRSRVSQVQNERQYSAATLEFDLVRQDLRKLEDMVIEKLQVVEDLEGRRRQIETELEQSRGEAGPRQEAITTGLQELAEQLAIKRDRRHNLAIRVEERALGLYDRIRGGRSRVAMAPLTEEAACGNCYTAVTIQQQMQIKGLSTLVCCEGCGVILYPEGLRR